MSTSASIDILGIRLGDQAFVADSGGYQALITWAWRDAFGIEGTASYGPAWHGGAPSGASCREVSYGKDTIDAEVAARSVWRDRRRSRRPRTVPSRCPVQSHDGIGGEGAHRGDAEADRLSRTVRNAARRDLTDLVCSPAAPDSVWAPLDTPTASAKHTLRALARQWTLSPRKWRHTTSISSDSRPRHHRPSVRASGSAPTRRPKLLIVFGDNPIGFVQKPPSQNSAARVPSRPRPG